MAEQDGKIPQAGLPAPGQPTLILPQSRETLVMTEDSPESVVQQEFLHIGSILHNKYELTRVLSENTGEASLFVSRDCDQEYVAKIYHVNKRPKQEILDLIRSIDCRSVIKPVNSGEIYQRYYEILPYYPNGDLQQVAPVDAEFLIKTVVPSVNEALHVLHEVGIVHRDVKPNNLFLSNDQTHVVLGDFGISSVIDTRQSVRYTGLSRTLGYSAPETAQGFVSRESDYYSLGITLLHLVTGIDPFLGMTDQQILKITLTDKMMIPTEVHPRIAHLIRGLTVKERSDRWGYEEIKKWCAGEAVPVNESASVTNVRPYMFHGRQFYDLKDLSLALADDWDEALKHLYRGFISEHVKQFGQDLASRVIDCEEERDQDLGLFRLIYILNPHAPLCWKGEIFLDLLALGREMRRHIHHVCPEYMELLEKGALLHYLKVRTYQDDLIAEIQRLQESCQTQRELTYYNLYYLLSSDDAFAFDNVVVHSIDQLLEYLQQNKERIESLSKHVLKSPYFFAWLEHCGFEELVKQWRNIRYE